MNSGERLTACLKLCKIFIRENKYDRAETLYNLCIKNFEADFRCYFNYAQLCCLQKRYRKALDLFYEAEKRNQGDALIYSALSGLLLKLQQSEIAVRICRKGLTLEPDNSSLWYNLNVSLRQVCRIDEAIYLSRKHIAQSIVDKQGNSCPLPINRPLKYEGLSAKFKARNSTEKSRNSRSRTMKGTNNFRVVFVCVKYGSKYGVEYVNNLYKALKRGVAEYYAEAKRSNREAGLSRVETEGINWRKEEEADCFRFVCYTDDLTGLCEGVEVELLPGSNIPSERAGSGAEVGIPASHDNQSGSNLDISTQTERSDGEDGGEYTAHDLSQGMRLWKGWWYKAYLFYAVKMLRAKKKQNGPGKVGEGVEKPGGIEGEGGVETAKNSADDGVDDTPIWVCYLDLDTVLQGSLLFLFDLLAQQRQGQRKGTHTDGGKGLATRAEAVAETDQRCDAAPDPEDCSALSSEDHPVSDREHSRPFFTLSASHFPSEGRQCGLNSSVMIWQLDPPLRSWEGGGIGGRGAFPNAETESSTCATTSTGLERTAAGMEAESEAAAAYDTLFRFETLFSFLLDHYAAVTSCVYKFDHYLEMMFAPSSIGECSGARVSMGRGGVRVVYLQDMPGMGGRILDFSSLLAPPPSEEYATMSPTAPSPCAPSPLTSQKVSAPTCDTIPLERDYTDTCIDQARLLGVRVLCFPLSPKPHQVACTSHLIRRLWEGEEVEGCVLE